MTKKQVKKPVTYWKNLAKNYPRIVPSTFALMMGGFFLMVFFTSLINIVNEMDGDSQKLVVLIVLVFAMLKLMNWIGTDLLNTWAKELSYAMCDE